MTADAKNAILDAFRRGDVNAAEALLPADNLVVRAYADLCRGRPYAAAERLFDAAAPPHAFAVFALVEVFRGSQAIETLPAAIESDEQSPDDGGTEFPELDGIADEPLNEEIARLRDEVRRAPADARAQFRLGEVLAFRRGDAARGRVHLEHAVRLAPHRALYWGFLGELVFKTTSAAEAIEYYNRALIADPRGPRWHVYRAMVLGRIFHDTLLAPLPVVDTRQEWLRQSTIALEEAERQLDAESQLVRAARVNLETATQVAAAMPELDQVAELLAPLL